MSNTVVVDVYNTFGCSGIWFDNIHFTFLIIWQVLFDMQTLNDNAKSMKF